MSILMDGISNVNALSGQISNLQALSGQDLEDPKILEFALQQNFNQMLEDLISSTNDNDDDEEKSDPFSFIIPNQQTSLQSLQEEGAFENTAEQPLAINPYTLSSDYDLSSTEYLNSLVNLDGLFEV